MEPVDPEYQNRVRENFARQGAIELIGATLADLQPGRCAIRLPYQSKPAKRFLPRRYHQHHRGFGGWLRCLHIDAGGFGCFDRRV
jgi:hypothetical protein